MRDIEDTDQSTVNVYVGKQSSRVSYLLSRSGSSTQRARLRFNRPFDSVGARNIATEHVIVFASSATRPLAVRMSMWDDDGTQMSVEWGRLTVKRFTSGGALLYASSSVLSGSTNNIDVISSLFSDLAVIKASGMGNGPGGLGFYLIDAEIYNAS